MNSVGGLLQNLPTRLPADTYDLRNGSQDPAQSENGEGSGFGAVLSGLAQNSSADGGAAPVQPSI